MRISIKHGLLFGLFLIIFMSVFLLGNHALTGNVVRNTNFNTSFENEPFFKDVSPSEAYSLINNNEVILLDIRSTSEHLINHINGSLNIDFHSSEFRQKLSLLDKNESYLIYCRSGNRSSHAKRIMSELGFKHIYNLEGGLILWTKQELPIV